jgi:hypothetical protein
LDLSAVVRHTESSGTLCSVTSRILIQWCRANHLHLAGLLPQERSTDELPKSLSRTCSCPATGGAAGDPLHDMLTGARGGGGGGLSRGACPRPCLQPVDHSRMSSAASSVALVHTICHK